MSDVAQGPGSAVSLLMRRRTGAALPTVAPAGIPSAEAFGVPSVVPGAVTASPTGVPSAEAFGTPEVTSGTLVSVAGIATSEAFGAATLAAGAVSVSPAGVPSSEAFGSPSLASGTLVSPAGIPSSEAFGVTDVSAGPLTLSPAGIPSAAAFGTPAVSPSTPVVFWPTLFNPLQVQNALFWLNDTGFFQDAAGTVPASRTGDPVNLWVDQSANHNNAVAASGAASLLLGGVNGHPSVVSRLGSQLTVAVKPPLPVTVYAAFRVAQHGTLPQYFLGDPTKLFGVDGPLLTAYPGNEYDDTGVYTHIVKLYFAGGSSAVSVDGEPDRPAPGGLPFPFTAFNVGPYSDPEFLCVTQFSEVAAYAGAVSPSDDAKLKNYFINKYAYLKYEPLCNSTASMVRGAGFTPNNVYISMRPEPYPLAQGPAAFVMPLDHSLIRPQAMGGGRYFYGMEGRVAVRVYDDSLSDQSYQDAIRLVDAAYGLYRSAHSVIDRTQVRFPLDANGLPVTQEPLIVDTQTQPQLYKLRKGGPNWSFVDLIYKIKYTSTLFHKDIDVTGSPPAPSTLADVLSGFRDALYNYNIFNYNQIFISLHKDPFPVSEAPFALVTPGAFRFNPPNVYGAGRNYASAEGTVTVHVVTSNLSDVTGRSDYALNAADPAVGLLRRVAAVVDRMQLLMLSSDGVPLVEMPVFVQDIGKPEHYGVSGNLASVPVTFAVRYQQKLSSLPDSELTTGLLPPPLGV